MRGRYLILALFMTSQLTAESLAAPLAYIANTDSASVSVLDLATEMEV
jgi:hypothetical protein